MGQLQLIVASLPPVPTAAGIQEYLKHIVASQCLRVADLLVITKNVTGEVSTESPVVETEPLFADGLLLQLLGYPTSHLRSCNSHVYLSSSEGLYGDYGLNSRDIDQLVDQLPHDSLTLFLLVEELWSAELRRLLRANGGITLASGVVSQEALEREG